MSEDTAGPSTWAMAHVLPSIRAEREETATQMAHIEFTPQALIVHITGADRLWALKSHLEIPLAHVIGASQETEEAQAWLKGLVHGGITHVPGVLSAGTFHHHGDRVFWDVHDPDKAIAISLKDDRYARLVVEVDDPVATLAAITKAIPLRVVLDGEPVVHNPWERPTALAASKSQP